MLRTASRCTQICKQVQMLLLLLVLLLVGQGCQRQCLTAWLVAGLLPTHLCTPTS